MPMYTPISLSLFGRHCEVAPSGDRDFARPGNRHWIVAPNETAIMGRMPTVASPHVSLTDLFFDAGHRPRLQQESGVASLTRLEDVYFDANFHLLFTRDTLFIEAVTKLDLHSSLDEVNWASTDTIFPFTDNVMICERQDNVTKAREKAFFIDAELYERAKPIELPCLLLANHGSSVYYHWLLEGLSRTWFLHEYPELADLKLLMPRALLQFNMESLLYYGIGENRIAGFDGGIYHFKTLFVPSFLASRQDASRRTVDYLRSRMHRGGGGGPKRFYISRSDAITRQVTNEAAITEALARFGVEVVSLIGMPFAEQVALFRDAELVVAPHGGGLANIAYCREGTAVVELSQRRWHPCFWHLSNLASCRHHMVMATSETQRLARHPYVFRTGTNPMRMEFDVGQVVAAVEAALAEGA